jgi:hypothetical protein
MDRHVGNAIDGLKTRNCFFVHGRASRMQHVRSVLDAGA